MEAKHTCTNKACPTRALQVPLAWAAWCYRMPPAPGTTLGCPHPDPSPKPACTHCLSTPLMTTSWGLSCRSESGRSSRCSRWCRCLPWSAALMHAGAYFCTRVCPPMHACRGCSHACLLCTLAELHYLQGCDRLCDKD